jgi:membrane-associated HD superfamily phosphohydrolase
MSFALFSYCLLSALRERFLPLVVLVFALVAVISYTLGAAAMIEKQQFILVFAGFGLRLVTVISLIVFSVFFVRRSFDVQEVPFFVSGAMGRFTLLFSYAVSLGVIALIVSLAASILLAVLAPVEVSSIALWAGSLALESVVVVTVSLFFAGVLKNAPAAIMAVLGFYVLARLNGHLLGIVDAHSAGGGDVIALSGEALTFILALFPRLDLMGQGGWLLYGAQDLSTYGVVVAQSGVFCVVVFAAALVDFLRKQF